MNARTDIHRPSAIIPADYDFVCVNYRDEFGLPDVEATNLFRSHREETGGVFAPRETKGGCYVCGAWMIDYAIFHHVPTNTYIETGCDCAGHIESGHEGAFRRVSQLRRAAKKRKESQIELAGKLERMGILDQVETYFAEGELGGPVFGYDQGEPTCELVFGVSEEDFKFYQGDFNILIDLVRKLEKWSSLSDKQESFLLALAKKFKDLPATIQAEKDAHDNLPDVPEGEVELKGEILSKKNVETWTNGYSSSYTTKIVLLDERGFKVYGTLQSKIDEAEKGDIVSFTATVKPKEDDSKFGFFKRPNGAKIIKGES